MILSQDARRQINKALVPSEILEKGCAGELRAVFHPSSGILNIFPCDIPLVGEAFLKGCCDYPECRQDDDGAYDFRIVVDENDERYVLLRGARYEAHA